MEHESIRREIIDTARAMVLAGLATGMAGNVSARAPGGMLITPSGVEYDALETGDIVFVDEGGGFSGPRPPSSEWRFHLDIYLNFPNAGAVVHAHPPNATALACAGKSIPQFHYMVAVAGGNDIPLAPYHLFGTAELSGAVIAALKGRRACLMANHGMVAYGADLAGALYLALEVEELAKQYILALQAGGPVLLDDKQMLEAIERFKSYGKNAG